MLDDNTSTFFVPSECQIGAALMELGEEGDIYIQVTESATRYRGQTEKKVSKIKFIFELAAMKTSPLGRMLVNGQQRDSSTE